MKKYLCVLLTILFGSAFSQTAEEYYLYAQRKSMGLNMVGNTLIKIDDVLDVENDLKNQHEAIAGYSKAIELDPKMAKAYWGRGDCFYELGIYNKAILDFTKALYINPNFAEAYYSRGLCRIILADKDGACYDFHKAVEFEYNEAFNDIIKFCK